MLSFWQLLFPFDHMIQISSRSDNNIRGECGEYIRLELIVMSTHFSIRIVNLCFNLYLVLSLIDFHFSLLPSLCWSIINKNIFSKTTKICERSLTSKVVVLVWRLKAENLRVGSSAFLHLFCGLKLSVQFSGSW